MEAVKMLAVIFLAIFLILFGVVQFFANEATIIHYVMDLLAFVSGILFLVSIRHFHVCDRYVCDKYTDKYVDKTK